MLSHQISCGLLHPFYIQLMISEIAVQTLYGLWKFPAQDPVFIGLAAAAMPGMEVRLHLTGALDPDILRQLLVQGIGKLLCGYPAFRIKNSHIPKGMYPRVCAACPNDLDLLPKQPAKRLIQFSFYGKRSRLKLPPVIGGSVISNHQLDSFH